jgi:hypothetical protein
LLQRRDVGQRAHRKRCGVVVVLVVLVGFWKATVDGWDGWKGKVM